MKKQELSKINEFSQINDEIAHRFEAWDSIVSGKDETFSFVSDGFRLNILRNDIIQLRKRRDKKYPNEPIVGQLTLFGTEVQEERKIPPKMPNGYMNPKAIERKNLALASVFD